MWVKGHSGNQNLSIVYFCFITTKTKYYLYYFDKIWQKDWHFHSPTGLWRLVTVGWSSVSENLSVVPFFSLSVDNNWSNPTFKSYKCNGGPSFRSSSTSVEEQGLSFPLITKSSPPTKENLLQKFYKKKIATMILS